MATYYINADTGNDITGDGSQGNPWLTPAYAYGQATSGDTIFCQNSTASFAWPTIANVINPITFQGESTSGVVFSANNTLSTFNYKTPVTSTFENITFSDLLVTSTQTGGWDIEIAGVNVNFYNCIFKDNSLNNNRAGIIFFRNNGDNSPVNFTSCLFYNNSGGGTIIGNGAQTSLGGSFLNFYNTVIDFNASSGSEIDLCGSYGGTQITISWTNCIVINNQGNQPGLNGGVTSASYSCFYGSFSSVPTGTGVITSDPLFIDPANNNYNLSPSSPCIDAGTLV